MEFFDETSGSVPPTPDNNNFGALCCKLPIGHAPRIHMCNIGEIYCHLYFQILCIIKAWGLKDDQMEVRIAAAQFVLTIVRLNSAVFDLDSTKTVVMTEVTERKSTSVKDSLVGRVIKLIKRNRYQHFEQFDFFGAIGAHCRILRCLA